MATPTKTKHTIKSWLTGAILFECEAFDTKDALRQAIDAGAVLTDAILRGADFTSADLTGAILRGADLTDAVLRGADLTDAVLRDADFTGADLRDADFTGADLTDAVLRGADFTDAVLRGAILRGAVLTDAVLAGAEINEDTRLDTGETWKEYVEQVVPALLTAGGKTVKEIVASGAWDCHTWSNCPMHAAFGISDEIQAPTLLRPRVRQFVRLFDANLIPCPKVD